MPAVKSAATTKRLVHSATESKVASGAKRIRLSKALPRPSAKVAKGTKADELKSNGAKPKRLKLLSNRYKMPESEYAQLTMLKQRLLALGVDAKRSELLRVGLMLLVAVGDAQLKKAVARIETIKIGSPPKKAG